MKKINFAGVDKSTWIRVIGLFLVLANQISISFFEFNLLGNSDEKIYEAVSTVLTVSMAIFAGWKNNSFTEEAQLADEIIVAQREQ